jgi:hypothetical protein
VCSGWVLEDARVPVNGRVFELAQALARFPLDLWRMAAVIAADLPPRIDAFLHRLPVCPGVGRATSGISRVLAPS